MYNGSAKPPVSFNMGIAAIGGGATGYLPKARGAYTAARTAWVEVSMFAVLRNVTRD